MRLTAAVQAVAAVLALSAGTTMAARETIDEAASHTRELIAYRSYGIGTLMSSFGSEMGELADLPIGLQEYYAPFPVQSAEDEEGDLLLLAMPLASLYRNALPPHRPNLTITIADLYGLGDGNLAAGRMRCALFGTLEKLEGFQPWEDAYLAAHPDARGWVPPGGPHNAFYARFKVEKVYAFNGFGNVAYIGWIPLDMYRNAPMRAKKATLKDWPVPEQPERGLLEAAAEAGDRQDDFKIQI